MASQFSELHLDPAILSGLTTIPFTQPTAVQAEVIPQIIAGHEVFVRSETGSGKTASYILPLLHGLLDGQGDQKGSNPQVLVVVPTRELAEQIHQFVGLLQPVTGLKSVAIYGGVDEDLQKKKLSQRPQLVVATPGRLIDFIDQKVIDLDKTESVVLDEADRLLAMGFRSDIESIFGHLNSPQVHLFSATLNEGVRQVSEQYQQGSPKDIDMVARTLRSVWDRIEQKVFYVDLKNKAKLLDHLLREGLSAQKILVFVRTRQACQKLTNELQGWGWSCEFLHGKRSQDSRQKIVEEFDQGKTPLLVSTDVAARGLDIDRIECVVNFDLPVEIENYIHRIGRTARAGQSGSALSFCEPGQRKFLARIERYAETEIPAVLEHPFPASPTRRRKRQKKVKRAAWKRALKR